MRLVVLEVWAAIAALVFLLMLGATALHRSAGAPDGMSRGSVLAECAWTVVPWLMMAACVFPAVRRIVASG